VARGHPDGEAVTPRGETVPLCPLVRDALDRRVRSIGEALVDGERAWAYSAEGGGGDEVARVTRTSATKLNSILVSEHSTRDEAAVCWRAYLGRCLLSGRVVTERRRDESAEAWAARHAAERTTAVAARTAKQRSVRRSSCAAR